MPRRTRGKGAEKNHLQTFEAKVMIGIGCSMRKTNKPIGKSRGGCSDGGPPQNSTPVGPQIDELSRLACGGAGSSNFKTSSPLPRQIRRLPTLSLSLAKLVKLDSNGGQVDCFPGRLLACERCWARRLHHIPTPLGRGPTNARTVCIQARPTNSSEFAPMPLGSERLWCFCNEVYVCLTIPTARVWLNRHARAVPLYS